MAKTMGIYCKAYQLKQLRVYHGWRENAAAARPASMDDANSGPRVLDAEDVVYMQDNYAVTDGIFKDENVIFDGINDDWVAFCRNELNFAIPEDVLRASQLATA